MPDSSRDARASSRDRRSGDAWSRAQRWKNDALWWLASGLLALAGPLSVGALRRWGRCVGRLAHAVCGSARRTARANVALVFGDRGESERRALVRRCFETLGEALGETVALLRADSDMGPLDVSCEAAALLCPGAEVAARSPAPAGPKAPARGVLFVSAHLGAWERVAASLVAAGVPLVAVARESYDPRFSRLYARLRRRVGVKVLWRGSARSTRAMLRTLRAGGVLGVPMDLRSRVPSRPISFLGHVAETPIGPARMALRAGAAVVVGSIAPGPARSGPMVTATAIPSDDLPSDESGALELTARINAELSRRILALPHAWVWMHDRWTARPRV